MEITAYNKTKFGIEGTGVDTVTTKEKKWINNQNKGVAFFIPAGTRVHVDFSPKKHSSEIFITVDDQVKVSKIRFASGWLRGFSKAPSIKTLERQYMDGIVKTCTGKRVEPDGYGPDGSPSWLLVLNMI